MSPPKSGSIPDVAAVVDPPSSARMRTCFAPQKGTHWSKCTKTNRIFQIPVAEPMRPRWTAAAAAPASVDDVCVNQVDLGWFMGNTAKLTTSPAPTTAGYCVEDGECVF